jgi:integrase
MRKRLSRLTLEQKAPKVERLEVRDSESPLVYRITRNGARSFSVRTRLAGKQVRFTYSGASSIGNLENARSWAHEIVQCCKAGVDPKEKERRTQLKAKQAEALRFANVAGLFIERHAKKNRSWRDSQAIFNLHVLPQWGNRPITDIACADVAALLDVVEDQTSVYRTNRVLAAVRKLFNWATARGMIGKSPVGPGMARPGERSRDRYLDAREIQMVWKAAGRLGHPGGTLIQLLLVTGQRRSEVAGMRWDELDLDDEKLWTLPPEHTKAGRGHFVPLSDLAIDLVRAAPATGSYVLTTRGDRPVSGFSKWKARLDNEVLVLLRQEAAVTEDASYVPPLPHWRFHDLRRTVATHMEELGTPPHIVGSVLNHDPKGYKGVTSVYTRGDLIHERRKALTAWARYLGLPLQTPNPSVIEKLLTPGNEADARHTDDFRRLLQADEQGWQQHRGNLPFACSEAKCQ